MTSQRSAPFGTGPGSTSMSSLSKKTRFINNPGNKLSFGNRDWSDDFISLYDESFGRRMYGLRPEKDKRSSPRDGMTLRLKSPDILPRDHLDLSTTSVISYIHTSNSSYCTTPASDYHANDIRKRSGSSRRRFEVVTELGPEEVRWFYKEDKKTWKPFMGHDSLRIEIMHRRFCELNPERSRGGEEIPRDDGPDGGEPSLETCEGVDVAIEAVCVRGGLYEVDVRHKECYPVYWNRKCCSFTDSSLVTFISVVLCTVKQDQSNASVL